MQEYKVVSVSYGKQNFITIKKNNKRVNLSFDKSFFCSIKPNDIIRIYENQTKVDVDTFAYINENFDQITSSALNHYIKSSFDNVPEFMVKEEINSIKSILGSIKDKYKDEAIKQISLYVEDQPNDLNFHFASTITKIALGFKETFLYRKLNLLGLYHYDVINIDYTCMNFYNDLTTNPYKVPCIKGLDSHKRKLLTMQIFGTEPDPISLLCDDVHNEVYKINQDGFSGVSLDYMRSKYPYLDEVLDILPDIFVINKNLLYYKHVYTWYERIAHSFLSLKGMKSIDDIDPDDCLDEHQADIIMKCLNHPVSFITGGAGTGKCLGPNVLILKSDNTKIKAIDVKVGDLLMSPIEGYQAEVLSITSGMDIMYEIIHDGDNFICNINHIMTVIDINGEIQNIPLYNIDHINNYKLIIKKDGIMSYSEFNIRNLGIGKYYGFTLKPYFGDNTFTGSHFLLADGTITHNTTCMKTIVKTLKMYEKKFICVAPTGCAVSRINKALKDINIIKKDKFDDNTAMTLHSLAISDILSDLECIIVDEFSMVTSSILSKLLYKAKKLQSIIFLGDLNQLPIIGCGDVMRETVMFELAPIYSLEYNYRSESKLIKKMCDDLLNNNTLYVDDYSYKNFNKSQLIKGDKNTVLDIFKHLMKTIPKFQISDFTCLAAYNKDVDYLNESIKKIYNYKTDDKLANKKYSIGDIVIHTEKRFNDLYNGSKGIVIEKINKFIICEFDSGNHIYYPYETQYARIEDDKKKILKDILKKHTIVNSNPIDLKYLKKCYALTVDKSQGSEWKYVIFYLSRYVRNHTNINRIYTALSRAKTRIYFVCNINFHTLFSMINNNSKRNPPNSNINYSPFYDLMKSNN